MNIHLLFFYIVIWIVPVVLAYGYILDTLGAPPWSASVLAINTWKAQLTFPPFDPFLRTPMNFTVAYCYTAYIESPTYPCIDHHSIVRDCKTQDRHTETLLKLTYIHPITNATVVCQPLDLNKWYVSVKYICDSYLRPPHVQVVGFLQTPWTEPNPYGSTDCLLRSRHGTLIQESKLITNAQKVEACILPIAFMWAFVCIIGFYIHVNAVPSKVKAN